MAFDDLQIYDITPSPDSVYMLWGKKLFYAIAQRAVEDLRISMEKIKKAEEKGKYTPLEAYGLAKQCCVYFCNKVVFTGKDEEPVTMFKYHMSLVGDDGGPIFKEILKFATKCDKYLDSYKMNIGKLSSWESQKIRKELMI